MPQVCSGLDRLVLVIVAVQPSPVTVIVPSTLPVVTAKFVPRLLVYFTESAKYASSAVTRLRRSVFIDAMYAFCFVLANFGIAIAARMPMITTTINSSMSVKPFRFIYVSRSRNSEGADVYWRRRLARPVPDDYEYSTRCTTTT